MGFPHLSKKLSQHFRYRVDFQSWYIKLPCAGNRCIPFKWEFAKYQPILTLKPYAPGMVGCLQVQGPWHSLRRAWVSNGVAFNPGSTLAIVCLKPPPAGGVSRDRVTIVWTSKGLVLREALKHCNFGILQVPYRRNKYSMMVHWFN